MLPPENQEPGIAPAHLAPLAVVASPGAGLPPAPIEHEEARVDAAPEPKSEPPAEASPEDLPAATNVQPGEQAAADATASEETAEGKPGPEAAAAAAVPPQHEDDGEETASEGEAPPPLPPPPPPPLAAALPPAAKPAARRRGGGGRGGGITLRLLVDEGILVPGEDALTMDYKGTTQTASLMADGRIATQVQGRTMFFESPSAFSVYLKRLINPSRKADDGWKTVKYNGRLLEHYKAELARRVLGQDDGGASTSAAQPAKRQRAAPAAPRPSTYYPPTFKQWEQPAEPEPDLMEGRPKRRRRAPPRFAALGVDDEHALQPLEAYDAGAQPFKVRVCPAAEVVMDFHAHLCMNEVIGILAGTWDAETKCLTVMRAIPVRELATEDDSINVEMDPEDQLAKMEEASRAGMRVVGWYHSHPTFPTQPSIIDIYNQVLQQHAHREEAPAVAKVDTGAEGEAGAGGEAAAVDEKGTVEPYLAAIVGPYDRHLPSHQSSLTWFYVEHKAGVLPDEGQPPAEVGCVAKALQVEQLQEIGPLGNLIGVQKELETLAKRYAQLPERAPLLSVWRDNTLHIQKLVDSVQSRMPLALMDEGKVNSWGSKVYVTTRAVWNVYGRSLPGGAARAAGGGTGSAAVSAAVSQGGTDAEADGSDYHHDADEPISDDDDA